MLHRRRRLGPTLWVGPTLRVGPTLWVGPTLGVGPTVQFGPTLIDGLLRADGLPVGVAAVDGLGVGGRADGLLLRVLLLRPRRGRFADAAPASGRGLGQRERRCGGKKK